MTRSPRFLLLLGLLGAAGLAGCRREAPAETGYQQRPPSEGGTGKVYLGREIAQPVDHGSAAWLDRPERDATELPDRVVAALDLRPTDVVADVGAGTGYFTFRLAAQVPQGRVLAEDIDSALVALIRHRADSLGLRNVTPIRGTIENPELPPASADVVLIVDSYHEFSHPREMMTAIARALKPGGRVVLVEYRGEDPTLAINPLHRMTQAQIEREMTAVGLRLKASLDVLPQQHLLVFERAR
ncbi:MAG TPA: class I SAM-dependent methyltransferase [Rhodothermales bacterium]|nr:class I SAM-dependent methyltransferase [Rhodothermales bacterium]